jgi:hypothetical protein
LTKLASSEAKAIYLTAVPGIDRSKLDTTIGYIESVLYSAGKNNYTFTMLKHSSRMFNLNQDQFANFLAVTTEYQVLPFEERPESHYPDSRITLARSHFPSLALLICCCYNDLLVAKKQPPETMSMEDLYPKAQEAFKAIRLDLTAVPELRLRYAGIDSAIQSPKPPTDAERTIRLSRKRFHFESTAEIPKTVDEVRQQVLNQIRKTPRLDKKLG